MARTIKHEPSTYFVFREAKSVAELEDLFRLRYRVYQSGRLARFIAKNDLGMDVDCYDPRSRHFGLFEVSNGVEEAIGYLRVVEDRYLADMTHMAEFCKKYPELAQKAHQPFVHPFPLMNYIPDKALVRQRYAEIRGSGGQLVEAGRMVLDECHRSLRLARHIFECAIVIYFLNKKANHAMACCDTSKKAFYAIYGFNHFEGTSEGDVAGIGVSSTLTFAAADRIPVKVQARLQEMAVVYRETGRICCVPGDSGQFRGPSTEASREPVMAACA